MNNAPVQINLDIPEKLLFFYDQKARYKVAYGGRGGGKSWAAAMCLVLLAYQSKHKILCTRAYQNSILDSVHSLLTGAIDRLGLRHAFDITKTGIRTKHRGNVELESEFIFKGLQNAIDEIKSMEGVTICWVEEAHSIDAHGWKTLIPTIRYKNAEIWVTFNPKETDDATYQRFVLNQRPNSVVVKINYYDNPFFKDTELVAEMEYDRDNNPAEYNHIWLGEPALVSEAAVFKGCFTVQAFEEHPQEVKYKKRNNYGLDFGYNHPTVGIRNYIVDDTLYITHEGYKKQIKTRDIRGLLDVLPDSRNLKWKIYADSARPDLINELRADLYETVDGRPMLVDRGFKNIASVKKTTKDQSALEKHKAKSYVKAGIDFMKRFKIVIHPRCVETIREFNNYKWEVEEDAQGREIILDELVDAWNHCIDAIRYSLADLFEKRSATMADIAQAIALRKAMKMQEQTLIQ